MRHSSASDVNIRMGNALDESEIVVEDITVEQEAVTEDVLVEEVSIDGMCGVY